MFCVIVIGTSITPGVEGIFTPGTPTTGNFGAVGVNGSGKSPKTTSGADTFTDTFGLICGNTGSTGLIFAPTSIVSLNVLVSTATPFPAISISFPIFPVDFNMLLPLLVP